MSARYGFRNGFAASAELEDDRISGGVAVVDGNVVLDVVAVVPDFEFASTGGTVKSGLTSNGN